MKPIDLIYRFDPEHATIKPPPSTADEARRQLEDGNRRFAHWVEACEQAQKANSDAPAFVVACAAPDLGMSTSDGEAAKQSPFAILFGCSDARVPAETIFGQLRNNLFVVRVAGNVLSDECLGSIEFAVHNLADSIRIVVVLGHTYCGAVTATVDTYLQPWGYLEKVPSAALRSIVDRLFVPVRKAARALEEVWGRNAPRVPGYRDALLETAVAVNAIQSAHNLQRELDRQGKQAIRVVYGVFDLVTHRVWTAPRVGGKQTGREVILADAPGSLAEFEELAVRIAIRAAKRVGEKQKGPDHEGTIEE
jgi:carbonic anhydrase